MYLTAMTYRDALFDLTMRWMNDDFHPDDGETVTRIFVYESAVSTLVIDRVIRFLGRVFKRPLQMQRVYRKRELRDRLMVCRPRNNPRMEELAQNYYEEPALFFPYLPVDAIVLSDEKDRLIAIARIKRLSRIAEKVSYRLVDALFKEIQAEAEHFAELRAAAAGVPLIHFVSSPAAMQEDFIAAEAAVARRFMDKQIRIGRDALTVNDILGFKIVGEASLLADFPGHILQEPGMTLVEIENHQGDYNAVNLLLDLDLPPADVLAEHLMGLDWEMARRRGLRPDHIRDHIPDYVRRGARSVRIEMILTTPEELMEAEFGRSIHELRILRLRQRQAYSGILGQNAGYLIEYLLTLASSGTISIPEIPIKLYGRYLPEEISALKGELNKIPMDGGLLGVFHKIE